MNRKKAREYAFIILFQYKFQPEKTETVLNEFYEEYDAGDQKDYISDVVLGTKEHIKEIDELISKNLQGWSLDRLSAVSLAVLRLSVYELLYRDDIPNPVSVNEAVSLVKEYEGEEAAPFTNAVLDLIAKPQ